MATADTSGRATVAQVPYGHSGMRIGDVTRRDSNFFAAFPFASVASASWSPRPLVFTLGARLWSMRDESEADSPRFDTDYSGCSTDPAERAERAP